jgi:hypothetical protein
MQQLQCRGRAAGRRWQAGAVRDASAALEMAFEAGGLSARERYVIRQRLCGRPFGEIAADPELGDGPEPSRQRIEQLERRALAKLGTDVSIGDLHEQERRERAVGLRARGRLVRVRELTVVAMA